jgi:hypothetical protein
LDEIQISKKNIQSTFTIFNEIIKKPKLGYLGSKLQRSLSRVQISGNSNKSNVRNSFRFMEKGTWEYGDTR